MPPKKATTAADASKLATTGDEPAPAPPPAKEAKEAKESVKDGVNIEDYNLPKSIVTRLAKGVLPPNTQIQGNAMLAMTKGATVFVNYLASHANEFAQREGRKTLNPNDVLRALDELEFPDFKPRLEAELAKFNEIQADKRNNYKNKVATANANKGQGGKTTMSPHPEEEEGGDGDGEVDGDADGEPAAKRVRRDGAEEMTDSPHVGGARGGVRTEEDEEEEEDDDEEEEDDGEEDTLEVDETTENAEREEGVEIEGEEEDGEEENEDEALDNGEDSD